MHLFSIRNLGGGAVFSLQNITKRKTEPQALRVGEGHRVSLQSESLGGEGTGPQGQGAEKAK